jgi:hypothetical protein
MTICEFVYIVWKVDSFVEEILPKYFKHSNFASFTRQLHKVSKSEKWRYMNIPNVFSLYTLLPVKCPSTTSEKQFTILDTKNSNINILSKDLIHSI